MVLCQRREHLGGTLRVAHVVYRSNVIFSLLSQNKIYHNRQIILAEFIKAVIIKLLGISQTIQTCMLIAMWVAPIISEPDLVAIVNQTVNQRVLSGKHEENPVTKHAMLN